MVVDSESSTNSRQLEFGPGRCEFDLRATNDVHWGAPCGLGWVEAGKGEERRVVGRFVYLYFSLGCDDSYTSCGGVRVA